jgi:hypothetical protein
MIKYKKYLNLKAYQKKNYTLDPKPFSQNIFKLPKTSPSQLCYY